MIRKEDTEINEYLTNKLDEQNGNSFLDGVIGCKFIIVRECDWNKSKYRTVEWEHSVNITRWEHDFEKGVYVIEYEDL
tara:strand:+ start:6864 stop:7097 length:234 start_codon:yes stop_codon:yes gene_type:complete